MDALKQEDPESLASGSQGASADIRGFDLLHHLGRTPFSRRATRHLRIGVENWLATQMMRAAVRIRAEVPEVYRPRPGHYAQIEREMHSESSKRRQLLVFVKMPFLGGVGNDNGIDYMSELPKYDLLDYPAYYLQPFHSVPGGWLSPVAASGNESAMRALFQPSNARGAAGLREAVAAVLPADAKLVYDFGCTCGAQAAAFAERLGPDATVHAIDASPFGLIHAKKSFTDPRIKWTHGLIEALDLPPGKADFVNLLFVLHECPDPVKKLLLEKAFSVLRPGGQVLVSEPPAWDLDHRSRGFFEPYRAQWAKWRASDVLSEVGFSAARKVDLVKDNYMVSHLASKPT